MRMSSILPVLAAAVVGLTPDYNSDEWMCYNDYVFEMEASCPNYSETAPFNIDTSITGYITLVRTMCRAVSDCAGFTVFPGNKSMVQWNHNWMEARQASARNDAITCFDTNVTDPDITTSCVNSQGLPWTVSPTLSPNTLIPTASPVQSSDGLSQKMISVIILCVLVGIVLIYCGYKICHVWGIREHFRKGSSKEGIFI